MKKEDVEIWNGGYSSGQASSIGSLTFSELRFLEKVLERLKGYACGRHVQLEKMIKNRQKELKKR